MIQGAGCSGAWCNAGCRVKDAVGRPATCTLQPETNKEKTVHGKDKTLSQILRKELLKYTLYFFVCAWMFLLGLLVGRGTVPVRFNIRTLELELRELKEEAKQKEKEKVKDITENLSDKSNLSFPDALKDTRYDVKLQTEETVSEKKVQDILPEQAVLITKKEEETEKREASPISQPSLPNNPSEEIESTKKVSIQIASFRKQDDADRMAAQLKERGYAAYRSSSAIPGSGIWHRVRIGIFNRRIDAKSIMEKLKKENLIGMFVSLED